MAGPLTSTRAAPPRRGAAATGRVAAGLLLALATAGCSEPDPPAPVDLAGRWVLTGATIDGTTVAVDAGYGQDPVTLVLDDSGKGQAISGCEVSEVRAAATADAVTLSVPETGSMLSCPPGSVDRLRGAYADALEAVDNATRSDGVLELTGPGTRLQFGALKDGPA